MTLRPGSSLSSVYNIVYYLVSVKLSMLPSFLPSIQQSCVEVDCVMSGVFHNLLVVSAMKGYILYHNVVNVLQVTLVIMYYMIM